MVDCGVDPLRWDLKWVNSNVCYRLHPKVDPKPKSRRKPDEFMIDQNDVDFDGEPGCAAGLDGSSFEEIEQDGKLRASLHVPDRYLGRICGQQHSRRKEIETDTATSIQIPEKGSGEDIVVMGDTDEALAECILRLRTLMDNARSHDTFTHFISIPLTFDVVKKNLKEFQCLALAAVPALTEKLFIRERKLHLTICCLCLQDKVEVAQAKEVLMGCQDLVAEHTKGKPLNISIRGLEIMNDDPGVVNVLYAKVHEEGRNDAGRLQDLCDAVLERFRESRLIVNDRATDREHIKLHMTIMNSKFADDPNAVANPKSGTQLHKKTYENVKPFSAKKLLHTLGDQEFGTVQLKHVELNVISQVEPGTGYYRAVAKLSLPNGSGR